MLVCFAFALICRELFTSAPAGHPAPYFLHTAALESESYEYLHTQVKKIKRARTHQRSSRPGK